MRTLVSEIVFHMKGPDAPRSARGCRAISASPRSFLAGRTCARTGIGDGRRRDALVGLDLLVFYPHRCRLKARIHGRPRSDRKRRFLLSAVAFSTSTRHPREAKPIHWAQRGGLACRPGNCVLTPRPHFTAPSCTLGNREVCASDGTLFRQERRPTRVCRTPGPGSGLLAAAPTGTHEPVPTHRVDQAGCA